MKIFMTFFISLLMAGCFSAVEPPRNAGDVRDVYSEGHHFLLDSCRGVELTHEWLGPHGSNGPKAPPSSWEFPPAEYEFRWSIEVLKCNRLGWGPLERGPITIGWEVHNAYDAPAACYADLDNKVFLRYLHGVYLEKDDEVDYAGAWNMPVRKASFSEMYSGAEPITLFMNVTGSSASKMDVYRTGIFEENSASISVAFFWFENEKVHRLVLHRETRTTVGDVAVVDMAPPSIMADMPGPAPVVANWLSELQWVGTLVTFGDHGCTEQVFP